MNPKEVREVYNAVRLLHDLCAKQEDCLSCPCRGRVGSACRIVNNIPQYWNLREPVYSVFEEEDK